MAPALRIPLGLDMQSFDKSISDAKSKTAEVTDFIVKEFAKSQLRSQLKLVVNADGFKPAVQQATKIVGEQFDRLKPTVQAFTQSAVKESAEAGIKVADAFGTPVVKGTFQAVHCILIDRCMLGLGVC